MFKIGLTGSLGAGKSQVAKCWQDLGAGIVEGDEMGRIALESDSTLVAQLAERFGDKILDENGSIIRRQLANAAFSTREGTEDLTRLTFPTLYRIANEQFDQLADTCDIVVFDAALIFEWGIEKDFNLIVVVTAQRDMLLERVMSRLGIGKKEAYERLLGQMPSRIKEQRADRVIYNNGSLEVLKKNAATVWDELSRLL